MDRTFLWIFFVTIALSNGFFIKSRDIKKFFNFFPNIQDDYVETNKHKPPIHSHPQRRPRPIPIQEVYYNDYEDYNERNDNQRNYDNKSPNPGYSSKSSVNPSRSYFHKRNPIKHHSHENCDHDYKLKKDEATKFGENEDNDYPEPAKSGYYFYPSNKKNHAYNSRKTESSEKDKDEIFDYTRQPLNYKKDYISGVLVAVPKIKKGYDVDDYFEQVKHKNPFSENFGKGEDLDSATTEANLFSFFDSFKV